MPQKFKDALIPALGLLLMAALSAAIYLLRDQTEQLAAWGYPGIFALSILSNATIILPAPAIALVFTLGSVLNPFAVGTIAGIGSGIGELSGYLAGKSGSGLVTKTETYKKIHPFVDKYGVVAIFILAIIPNPFFDVAGIAAGALRMPVRRFFLWCTAGKIIKMLLIAFGGAQSIPWLMGAK